MAEDYTKGYSSTQPEDANPGTPKRYDPPGTMADAVEERWKKVKEPYPFGKNTDGGQ